MPIYEYACGACEHRFETIQRASEAPLTDCPACGASALRKLLSAPVFRLKGGGWYETDFKTGKKKNVSGDGGEGKDNADTSGDSSGDGSAKSKTSDTSDGGKKGDAKSTSAKTGKAATAAGG